MGSTPGPSSRAGTSHGSCRRMDKPRLDGERPVCSEQGGTRAIKLEQLVRKGNIQGARENAAERFG